MNPEMNKYRLTAAMLALFLLISLAVRPAEALAPTGVHDGDYSAKVTFYLPSVNDGELLPVTERLHLSSIFSPEESVLRYLLEYPADDEHRAIPGDGMVQLADGQSYINSRGTAVINFNDAYAQLDASGRYLLAQCVTNTLCALGRVSAVVILCEGRPISLSDQEEIPAGAFRQSKGEDLPLVQAQLMARRSEESALRYSADTALYYPAQAGHGIICETRSVSFPEPGEVQIVRTLLDALSAPPEQLKDVPVMPMLTEFLTRDPEIIPLEDDTRAVELHFSSAFNQEINSLGILRSVLLASIATTVISFMPDTSAVICYIGPERVGGLVPVGLYEHTNESIIFQDGLLKWKDFSYFQLTESKLYFPNDKNDLVESIRLLPASWADSPEKMISALIAGPSYYDSASDLHSAFPVGFSQQDILGIDVRNDTCLLNLSGITAEKGRDFSEREERNMIYSLVNVLTDLPWCKRVEIYLDGEQPDVFLHSIYLPGSFMRYTDYIVPQ